MAQIETRPRYQRYFHEIRRKIDRSLAADSPDCDCVRPGNKSVVENRAINSGYKAVPPRWPALFTIPTISTFSRSWRSLYCDVFLNATFVYPNGISRLKNAMRMLDTFFAFLLFFFFFLWVDTFKVKFVKRVLQMINWNIYIFLMWYFWRIWIWKISDAVVSFQMVYLDSGKCSRNVDIIHCRW